LLLRPLDNEDADDADADADADADDHADSAAFDRNVSYVKFSSALQRFDPLLLSLLQIAAPSDRTARKRQFFISMLQKRQIEKFFICAHVFVHSEKFFIRPNSIANQFASETRQIIFFFYNNEH